MRWAGLLVAFMFLATMIPASGEDDYHFFSDQQYFINDKYVVEIIDDVDPDEYDVEPLCDGRRAFLTITGMYTFEDWKFHAYGVTITEWFIYDGQEHFDDLYFYVDYYWLNGTVERAMWRIIHNWWTGWVFPPITGYMRQIYAREEFRELIDYIHVHAELLEEGFPMKS